MAKFISFNKKPKEKSKKSSHIFYTKNNNSKIKIKSFGIPIKSIKKKSKEKISFRLLVKNISTYIEFLPITYKLFIRRVRLVGRLTKLFIKATTFTLILFIIYLSFFDTYFLTKDYRLVFTGSDATPQLIQEISTAINKQKFFGILPYNNYWLSNSTALNSLLKQNNSRINNVKVNRLAWPNKIEIEVDIKPPFAAISTSMNATPLLIDIEGKIIGSDISRSSKNVIAVNTDSNITSQTTLTKANLNKIYFATELKSLLKKNNLPYNSIIISSFSEFDTDIIVRTPAGSKVLFDTNGLTKDNLYTRINNIAGTQLAKDWSDNSINYIDMRFERKIFICQKIASCSVLE
jgi:cell division septal protein FtsQ